MLWALVLAAVALVPIPAFAQDGTSFVLQVATSGGEALAGQPVSMKLSLDGSQDPAVYIVQVQDPDGYTAYLWYEEVPAGGQESFDISWTPEKDGRHVIQAFAWSSLQSPSVLSGAHTGSLDVSGTVSVTYCIGVAECFAGKVTKIVDGDTLDVDGVRIRLALVNSPERGEPGYSEATAFTAEMCPVGSTVLVDEDDGQQEGSYGRLIGKVFCGGQNLNAALLEAGHATVYTDFCSKSEFSSEAWVRGYC
jgi:endonuclease YncB( thermonuclease family)